MQTHFISCEQRPAPWGEPASEWPILGQQVKTHTAEALKALEQDSTSSEYIVLPENLLLSEEFVLDLKTEVEKVRRDGEPDRPLRCELGSGSSAKRSRARSSLNDLSLNADSLALPLIIVPQGQPLPTSLPELIDIARSAGVVSVSPVEKTQVLPSPRAYADPGKEGIEVSASKHIALYLEHRSHLQQANLEMLGAQLLRALDRPRWLQAIRYLWERFRPGARCLFSEISSGCKIHPTAIVEGSSLGANCEVGAYAIVRGCVLGEGVSIEDGAHLHLSSLGDKVRVARQTSVFASVLMEGSHSAQSVMQMSVLGRHSATTSASWFEDVRLKGPVHVESPTKGDFVDSGTRFLGCDLGHNSFIGAGVTVAAGRMIPSNTRIVSNPMHSLRTLKNNSPSDGGGLIYTVREGHLEPLE
jgi:carbonic anhydrase/acetyltransferase-like protein (isoleucine patch superfamily)